jgi:peroxiredoxin 2/4
MKTYMITAWIIFMMINVSVAQNNRNQSIPLIGHDAPSFRAQSTTGLISFPSDFGKDWKIIFSHPKDFTPVCSSEILELAHIQDEFTKLGAQILVVSTDRVDSHRSWQAALENVKLNNREPVKIKFPILDDSSYNISRQYGMLDPQARSSQSIRGVFFIDPDNKIRAFHFYPNEVGRNIQEIKRTLIALQTNYNNQEIVMPANWEPGKDVMMPFVDDTQKAEIGKNGSKIYQVAWFMTYKRME